MPELTLSRLQSSLILFCLIGLFSNACQSPDLLDETQTAAPVVSFNESVTIPNQYIVVFKHNSVQLPALNSSKASDRSIDGTGSNILLQAIEEREQTAYRLVSDMLKKHHVSPSHIKQVYTHGSGGVSIQLNREELTSLRHDPMVAFIEEDRVYSLNVLPQIKTPLIPSSTAKGKQVIPYGVQRVGGSVDFKHSPHYNARWAWIVDTGIDLNHPDLNVSNHYSANFTSDPSADDGHGHGTHVAGIVAGKNNGIGVAGVAAGAVVVSIKVLNDNGLGTYSDVVAGLNYLANHVWPEDVVNLSLGGAPSAALDLAVQNIAQSGVKVVIAAGNQTQDANNYSPGRVNHSNIFTVGSIDNLDTFSPFSNYGTSIDISAPGEDIISTFINDDYASFSGTSMAAPHVTGVLLVNPNNFTVDGFSWTGSRYIGIISHK